MSLSRWTPFIALVVLLVAGLAVATYLVPRPAPQVACQAEALVESQVAEAVAFGDWASTNFLLIGLFGGALLFVCLYFQLFFWVAGSLATFLVVGLVGAVTYVSAHFWVTQASRWASEQVPSCLDEALRDPFAASYVAWSGLPARTLGSLPDGLHWTTLLRIDAMALTVLALAIGYVIYRGLRRSLHF